MKVVRQAISEEIQDKKKQECFKKIIKEDFADKIGQPRKLVKKSDAFETNLEPMEYSKIPFIP